MTRNSLIRQTLAGLLVLGAGSMALAQEISVGARAKTTSIRRTSVIVGADVHLQQDVRAGKIVDIVLNDSGCVDYVVVSYEQDYVIVPWTATVVDFDRRVVRLDITRDRFIEAPRFRGSEWPNFTDATFRTKIRTVFGEGRRGDVRSETDIRSRTDVKSRTDTDVERRTKDQAEPDKATRDRRDRDQAEPATKDNGKQLNRKESGERRDADRQSERRSEPSKGVSERGSSDKQTEKPTDRASERATDKATERGKEKDKSNP